MWLFLLPIGISPMVMLLLRITLEYGLPSGLLSPRRQSWTFLFGDTLALPLAFGAIGSAGIAHDINTRSDRVLMAWSIGVAVVVTGAFVTFDRPNYTKTGNKDRLLSPTKLWHDWIVYPVLVAALVYFGVPVLLSGSSSAGFWLILVGLASWIGLGAIDIVWIKPDPSEQHPRWQDTWFGKIIS